MAWSVFPWMFAWPRSAFIPPPGRPRILKSAVALRPGLRRSRRPVERRAVGLVRPGRNVVRTVRRVVPGEETVLEVVALPDDERGVRVVLHVVGVVEVVHRQAGLR